VKIAHEVLGDGEPLTLVHGLAYDRRGWGQLPALLAEHFRVVLIDNRGVGESDAPPGPYSVAQMAEDVVSVLDELGIEHTHLLGVSLGGYIAQEVALTHPERVQRLILVSTAPGGGRAVPMPAATQEVFARYPTMEREAGVRMFVEEIFRYRLERAPTVEAWAAQATAGATYDNSDRVASIAAPTLVLTGGADVVVDPRNAGVLGELIPGARVEVVPDRGHLMIWEDSERVAELVTEFLQS
jgi:pimeloyl-ACP methyl ester carboxylesterase